MAAIFLSPPLTNGIRTVVNNSPHPVVQSNCFYLFMNVVYSVCRMMRISLQMFIYHLRLEKGQILWSDLLLLSYQQPHLLSDHLYFSLSGWLVVLDICALFISQCR